MDDSRSIIRLTPGKKYRKQKYNFTPGEFFKTGNPWFLLWGILGALHGAGNMQISLVTPFCHVVSPPQRIFGLPLVKYLKTMVRKGLYYENVLGKC